MDATQAALLAKVQPAELNEQPLVTNNRDFNWVTDKICRIVETKTPIWWWICMAVALMTASFTGLGLLWLCLLYTSPSPRDGLLSRMPSSA